jgi:nucleoside-specific outer membrane channel protein Tsx
MKKSLKASLSAVTACTALCAMPLSGAFAAEWSDTWVGYRYGTQFGEPTNSRDITKHIFSFNHVSGYKYGTNFFAADLLMSDRNDPAAPIQAPAIGPGAQEIYAVYRHTLSLGKVTGSPNFKFGPVRDVGLTAGVDVGAKNDAFAPRVRKFVVGPTLSFDVPGFFDVSLLYFKEHNHNGIVPLIGSPAGMTDEVRFKPTYQIAMAWGIPVPAINAKFNGFLNHTGKKGKDGFGAETQPETLGRAYLMFDVGALMGKKETFYVGPGIEYWRNKFGSAAPVGADYTAWQLAAEIHF